MKRELTLDRSGRLLRNCHMEDSHSSSSLPARSSEDAGAGPQACCRFCFDREKDDELISPCICKGTQQFVHRSCLDHWRSVKARQFYHHLDHDKQRSDKAKFAFSHCTICKARYHLPVLELDINNWRWRRTKYQPFNAADYINLFYNLFPFIAVFVLFAYHMTRMNSSGRNSTVVRTENHQSSP